MNCSHKSDLLFPLDKWRNSSRSLLAGVTFTISGMTLCVVLHAILWVRHFEHGAVANISSFLDELEKKKHNKEIKQSVFNKKRKELAALMAHSVATQETRYTKYRGLD